MHAARGIEKLRAADSADAIVDGLLRRRAAVYVPSLLRPLSVLTSRCRAASSASSSARSAATRSPKSSNPRLARTTRRQEATRRPLPELVAEALTNDETAERTSAASPPQTSTSAASFSNSTHAPRPARRHHPRERTRQAATRSARTTNALLPTDTKASVRATVHQTLDMDDDQPSQRRRQTAASTRRSAGRGISPQAPRSPRCCSARRSSRGIGRRRDGCSGPPWPGLEQAGSPRGGSSKQQRSEATAHSCSRPNSAARLRPTAPAGRRSHSCRAIVPTRPEPAMPMATRR